MSILQKYGIKEVADVTFYSIDDTGRPVNPVLFLDTLKVSTIEQTAEEAEARGGKGNGLLILWDYGKDINVSLEDALFSAKSLAIMFGGGNIKKPNAFIQDDLRFLWRDNTTSLYIYHGQNIERPSGLWSDNDFEIEYTLIDDQTLITANYQDAGENEPVPMGSTTTWYHAHLNWYDFRGETYRDFYGWVRSIEESDLLYEYFPYEGFWYQSNGYIMKSEFFRATKDVVSFVEPYDWGWNPNFSQNGKSYTKVNPLFFSAKGEKVTSLEEGEEYFCTYDLAISSAQIIEISAKTFPGIYYVTGTTYCRNQDSGKDEMFEFIIPKAKIQSENTITLEAEGDPSVFNMNLRVLRDKNGGMMKLVKYELNGGDETEELKSELIHNHQLEGENAPPVLVTLTIQWREDIPQDWVEAPGAVMINVNGEEQELVPPEVGIYYENPVFITVPQNSIISMTNQEVGLEDEDGTYYPYFATILETLITEDKIIEPTVTRY